MHLCYTYDRYFLKALSNGAEVEIAHISGIRSQLEANNTLEIFKQSKAKNLCFLKRSAEDSSSEEEEDMVHLVYNLAPPPRKRPHTM